MDQSASVGAAATGPLAGVRVVEVGGIGPGPFACMMFADLGAEVVRIDRPGGEKLFAGQRLLLHRGRRSIVVDLRHPRGPEVVRRLAARADIVTEAFRPGVAERLGIGPGVLLAENPRLVYGRMTGWGQDGPLATTAGHDIDYIAVTGALHASGHADTSPQFPANLLGDFGGGGMLLAVGLLAAVIHARQSGRGQVVDAAIVDGTALLSTMLHGMMAAGHWRDERGVNQLDGGVPWYDIYRTADARHLAVGALEPQFYAELVRLLGFADDRPENHEPDDHSRLPSRDDPVHWPEIRRRFAERFASRTQAEWMTIFDGTDACVAPVLTMTDAPRHPQLAARDTFVTADGVVQPAPAPRFSVSPAALGAAPTGPGAHTRQTLSDWGFGDVNELIAEGAVVQA